MIEFLWAAVLGGALGGLLAVGIFIGAITFLVWLDKQFGPL
jgi:hypothetical protein